MEYLIVGLVIVVAVQYYYLSRHVKEIDSLKIEIARLSKQFHKSNEQSNPSSTQDLEIEEPIEEVVPEAADDLTEEENTRQAMLLGRVKLACKLASIHIDDLDNEYELESFTKRFNKAKDITNEITDDFYKGAALHSLIVLAHRANWKEEAIAMLSEVNEESIREEIIKEVGDEYT